MSENAALGYEIMRLRYTIAEKYDTNRVKKVKGKGTVMIESETEFYGDITIEYVNEIPISVKLITETTIDDETLNRLTAGEVNPKTEYLFPFQSITYIKWDKKYEIR